LPEFMAVGRWLLVVGALAAGGGLASSAIVELLAGTHILGYAEGARVVGRPIQVVALGLLAVVGPRAMESALAMNVDRARSLRRRFAWLSLAASLPYAALVAGPWAWNPLADPLPNAYAVEGLVFVTAVANTIQSLTYPQRSELAGSRQQVRLATVEVAANAAQVALAFTAVWIGAFAIPVSAIFAALTRWGMYARALNRYYRPSAGMGRLDHPLEGDGPTRAPRHGERGQTEP